MPTQTSLTATDLLRKRHEEIKALFAQTLHAEGTSRNEPFERLCAMLAMHETAEETFVHPLARSISDAADTIVLKRLEEELAATEQLAKLEAMTPTDDGFDAAFLQFQSAVLQHAEAEELELFPLIDAHCRDNELLVLADAIIAAETR